MKTPTILKRASKLIDRELRKTLKSQGHSNTGALESSIDSRVSGTEVNGEMLDYGFIVSDGVKSSRIPFRRGSGAKTSKYIDGLVAFFKTKGLSDEEAKSAAFATANVQRKEGMSTSASARFSKTGQRQNFIEISLENKSKEVDDILTKGMDEIFEKEFKKQKTETV